MKISVIIPVYNEINTVAELLGRVEAVPVNKEIIIVDDGSTDGTPEQLSKLGNLNGHIQILRHERNLGKGAALKTGFKLISGDIVIIQDADLEYNPVEYPRLVGQIENGADVVFGSRFLGSSNGSQYKSYYLGNRFITGLANFLTGRKLTDITTCYKAFRSEILHDLEIRSNGFGFDAEFTMKIAKKKLRIREVPISYNGRSFEEGKKIRWRDGFKAIFILFWFRFFD